MVCSLCGGSTAVAFTATDRNREVSRVRFAYERCGSCGTIALANVPADLSRYYPADYYLLNDPAELRHRAPIERAKLAFVREYVSDGTLIEIGPGDGGFATLARDAGFSVIVIEMDRAAAEALGESGGISAICSDAPAEALATAATADVIAMWHVLEHVARPGELIDAAAAQLRRGGALVVATPNVQSLQFRLVGHRWAHVDAPRHLHLVPHEALRVRAAAAGLREVHVTTSDRAGLRHNRFGWHYSLLPRPATQARAPWTQLPALGIELLVAPVERRGLHGSTYTAVFVKD